jgi:hypothetical protein
MIKIITFGFIGLQSKVVYQNLVRLYHKFGRISELASDMNELGDISLKNCEILE